ncbi:DUF882 domain-containing protein [Beijerinckia indica]|uniref:Murein endopeptidase K n=1 Tax=Beijerinckia indica subsp. indica (strain ATCC 9039 / DSM 1715 / NCIMB 8712) TaxID=395963 RepID=B2IER5_BEII9|nr:DUF882 domain-containing protein [Beijerinckia indica]ACB97005.1 protein of unknown function DUF882 [Beijerinckia indica subsp. indica ATCC 9039]
MRPQQGRPVVALRGFCPSFATGAIALMISLALPGSTETAEANGDTRTISLYHSHTGESIEATFRVNGHYDPSVLHKLNWFLRDFRRDEQTNMDPRLFDVIWEAYRAAGANQPIVVYSAYRSPETNAMLRRRSRAVAEFSQHMLGKAMDTTMPGMPMERIREIGMRMQRGGVGYYPSSNFVHLDVGHVRSWPRMSYEQLARLFPDGKTVHLASNGRAMPRFEEARAEIEANGGGAPVYTEQPKSKGLFAWLFGSHDEEDEGEAPPPRYVPRATPQPTRVASRTEQELPGSSNRMVWTDRRDRRLPASPLTTGPLATTSSVPAPTPTPPQTPTPRAPEAPVRTVVAALPPSRDLLDRGQPTASITSGKSDKNADKLTDKSVSEKAIETAVLLPSPPRRPSELAATLTAPVPVPPSRPMLLAALTPPSPAPAPANLPQEPVLPPRPERIAAVDPVASSTTAAQALATRAPAPIPPSRDPQVQAPALPNMITQGMKDSAGLAANPAPTPADTVLAYAPTAQMQGLRSAASTKATVAKAPLKTAFIPQSKSLNSSISASQHAEIIPARLDPSNFWVMTGATTMKNVAPSAFGPAIGGLRTAARIATPTLSKTLTAGYVSSFHATADAPATDRFMTAAMQKEDLSARNPSPGAVQVIDRSARHLN